MNTKLKKGGNAKILKNHVITEMLQLALWLLSMLTRSYIQKG